MKNTEDEVLQAKQTADTDMTYYGDGQPFEESELELLSRLSTQGRITKSLPTQDFECLYRLRDYPLRKS